MKEQSNEYDAFKQEIKKNSKQNTTLKYDNLFFFFNEMSLFSSLVSQ